jgi:hypothetical protein
VPNPSTSIIATRRNGAFGTEESWICQLSLAYGRQQAGQGAGPGSTSWPLDALAPAWTVRAPPADTATTPTTAIRTRRTCRSMSLSIP